MTCCEKVKTFKQGLPIRVCMQINTIFKMENLLKDSRRLFKCRALEAKACSYVVFATRCHLSHCQAVSLEHTQQGMFAAAKCSHLICRLFEWPSESLLPARHAETGVQSRLIIFNIYNI